MADRLGTPGAVGFFILFYSYFLSLSLSLSLSLALSLSQVSAIKWPALCKGALGQVKSFLST